MTRRELQEAVVALDEAAEEAAKLADDIPPFGDGWEADAVRHACLVNWSLAARAEARELRAELRRAPAAVQLSFWIELVPGAVQVSGITYAITDVR